jgi:hypothetical protein
VTNDWYYPSYVRGLWGGWGGRIALAHITNLGYVVGWC